MLMAFGEGVVDAFGATRFADHRVPEPGGDHPLVQAFSGVTERGVERDAVAGPETVQGDREVVDTDLGHGCLPSDRNVRCTLVLTVRDGSGKGSSSTENPPYASCVRIGYCRWRW
jgi:hypothetical protein